ncbi:LamG domain-containing protein [Streptomyces microflavus]
MNGALWRRTGRSLALSLSAAVLATGALGSGTAVAEPFLASGTTALAVEPQSPDSQAPTSAADSAGRQALAEAAAIGQRVEVVGERAEYATTFANPDGFSMTLEKSAVPVRVAKADGGWAEPDPTLVKGPDGLVRPKAAVAEMEFSSGGDGADLVKISEKGRSIELGWPGELPEARLDGERVIYENVLPNTNLILTATVEGFRQVLEVKTLEAARSSALKSIEFSLKSQGLSVREAPGGGLAAVDGNGNRVFQSPAARMWDSSGDVAVTTAATRGASKVVGAATVNDELPVIDASGPDGDPIDGPGDGDQSAVLDIDLTQNSIVVEPDAQMLAQATQADLPIYVDPSVEINESERTVLSSDGDVFYNFSGGTNGMSVGRCGTKVIGGYTYVCTSGTPYTNRMYFEFSPATLKGKKILDAEFLVTETYSFSCNATWVDLERTDPISSSTKWPGPTKLDQMGDRDVAAGRGSNCSPSQPRAAIRFHDNPDEPDENLLPTVKNFAAGKMAVLTLMLMAKDESDSDGHKRFDDDAVLKVTYVGIPALPKEVGLVSGASYICASDPAKQSVISDPTPQVQGKPLTASGGTVGAKLRIRFRTDVWDGAAWVVAHSDVTSPTTGFVSNLTKQSPSLPTLAEGKKYRLKALTLSYYDNQSSFENTGYSTPCYFTVDPTAPKKPVVKIDSTYSDCAVSCTPLGGPGKPGTFTFSPATGDTNNVRYEYLLSTATAWVKPTQTGSTISVPIAPTKAGTMRLTVHAVDSVGTGRTGADQVVEFLVAEGPEAIGQWRFDEASGVALDSSTNPNGTPNNATLATGASRTADGRRGELLDAGGVFLRHDTGLKLDGTAGYAATTGQVVDTRASYTVAAWVRMTDGSRNRTFVSQDGAHRSTFMLGYEASGAKWSFRTVDSDAPVGGTWSYSRVSSTQPAALGTWTHLTGVYNAKTKQVSLYVNGALQGSADYTTAWASPGGLQIGRTKWSDVYTDYAAGSIDEVRVWLDAKNAESLETESRLLVAGNKPAMELVADWHPTAAGTGPVSDYSGYGLNLTLSNGAVTSADGIVFDGSNDSAATGRPVVDDTGSFTISSHVAIDPAKVKSKPDGYIAQVAGQAASDGSSWGLWFKRTGFRTELDPDTFEEVDIPLGQWFFGRLNADGITFTGVETTQSDLSSAPVHLTGVHDAQSDAVTLYLSSAKDEATAFTAKVSTGGLSVGRSFAGSVAAHHLPGTIGEIRLWAGAIEDEEHLEQVVHITT